LNLSQILHPSRSFVPFAVKKELNSDNLFENYGSETGFGLDEQSCSSNTMLICAGVPVAWL
ncbi:MAG: hypothetical protein WCR47_00705, partial [Desulfoplanes sp.]